MLVNGQHYHLTAAISGEKPALLMLHGFTGTSETFQDSISGLKNALILLRQIYLGTEIPQAQKKYRLTQWKIFARI